MWMLLLSLLAVGVESPRVDTPGFAQDQETRSVPKDSVEVDGRGCVKGRVLRPLVSRRRSAPSKGPISPDTTSG